MATDLERKCPICETKLKKVEKQVLSRPLPGGNRVPTGEVIEVMVCEKCKLVLLTIEKGGGDE